MKFNTYIVIMITKGISMTDQLNVFAHITPHRQHFGAARDAICEIIDRTRAEPGCIEFRLSEDTAACTLHLYEEWRDEAALTSHHDQPYTKAVFEAYKDWLAEEPRILHLRPVR
jgi:quinol monooxygenase YgiN